MNDIMKKRIVRASLVALLVSMPACVTPALAAGTVLAGISNTATALNSAVSGGQGNSASGDYAAIAGGHKDTASGKYSFAGGGYNNTASGNWATAMGVRVVLLPVNVLRGLPAGLLRQKPVIPSLSALVPWPKALMELLLAEMP